MSDQNKLKLLREILQKFSVIEKEINQLLDIIQDGDSETSQIEELQGDYDYFCVLE